MTPRVTLQNWATKRVTVPTTMRKLPTEVRNSASWLQNHISFAVIHMGKVNACVLLPSPPHSVLHLKCIWLVRWNYTQAPSCTGVWEMHSSFSIHCNRENHAGSRLSWIFLEFTREATWGIVLFVGSSVVTDSMSVAAMELLIASVSPSVSFAVFVHSGICSCHPNC